jgi:hypothetical protein
MCDPLLVQLQVTRRLIFCFWLQELQKQRSLLSDVLEQRVPLSDIEISQEILPTPLPEKKAIGSREWMQGIGRRGLEALAGRKGELERGIR